MVKVRVRGYTRNVPRARKSRKSGRVGRGMKEMLMAQAKKHAKKLAKKGVKKLSGMAMERLNA